jgi:hypothetical protein
VKKMTTGMSHIQWEDEKNRTCAKQSCGTTHGACREVGNGKTVADV